MPLTTFPHMLDQTYVTWGARLRQYWGTDDQLATIEGTWLNCGPFKFNWIVESNGVQQGLPAIIFTALSDSIETYGRNEVSGGSF